MEFPHKLVAILNKELPSGVALNALAHITLGFSTSLDKETLHLNDYIDKDGHTYPNISKMPFIILRAKGNDICKTVRAARESAIPFGAFIHTMTGGTYQEQLDATFQTHEEGLTYYGCVLCGPVETVAAMTKRFSLWRD
ncbi:MAG: DUF2000 domain-containing protein [Alphaproteobacteria bacterium]|nr:DUF2000 domain-containing protein [Alphaproteobacteria bacterium]